MAVAGVRGPAGHHQLPQRQAGVRLALPLAAGKARHPLHRLRALGRPGHQGHDRRRVCVQAHDQHAALQRAWLLDAQLRRRPGGDRRPRALRTASAAVSPPPLHKHIYNSLAYLSILQPNSPDLPHLLRNHPARDRPFSFFLLFCASLRLDSPGFQTGALLIERVSRSTAQASSTLPAAQYGLEAHSTAAYSTVQRMGRVVSCQRVASYVLSLSVIFAFFFFWPALSARDGAPGSDRRLGWYSATPACVCGWTWPSFWLLLLLWRMQTAAAVVRCGQLWW